MNASANAVLVGLSNPETMRPLVGIGALVALQRAVPLYLGTVIERQNLESSAESNVKRRAETLIRQGVRFAKSLGQENVSGGTEVARQVAQGLARLAKQNNPALLVLGYSDSGDPFARRWRRFDRLIDAVARKVSCPLAVVRLRTQFPFKRVLVPVAGAVNLPVAADVVLALRRGGNVFVTFMHLVAPETDPQVARGRLQGLLTEENLDDAGELVVRVTENVQRALVRESSKYDLTVVGAQRQRFFARLLGDVAERIARDSPKSVMIIRGRQ